MTWIAICLVAALAATTWAFLVPRVRIQDDAAPDFATLVSARSTAAVALLAVAVGQALWLTDPAHLWMWVAYLGLGAPLAAVDLCTTFLPLTLHRLTGGTMALALIPVTLQDWRSGLGAVLGGLACFGFFHLAWRIGRSLGYGDVRLALLVGAVAGMQGATAVALALLAGTTLGAVHAIAHTGWARRRPGRPRHFAYGPALWLGPVVAALLAALPW